MEAVEENKIKRHCPNLIGHDRLFQIEYVLINVLSWLPVKTLLRFKGVCKQWRNLISDDPYFIHLHSQQSKSKQPLLLFSSIPADSRGSNFLKSMDREKNPISRFEVKFENSFTNLLPTRFDLVCIKDDQIVHICNPSTHEYITLPKSHVHHDYSVVGFGYVQSTDEYKVVRLISPDYSIIEEGSIVEVSSFKTKCQVFTLGMERRGSSSCSSSTSSSWAWRDVVDSPFDVSNSSPPAFVNGAIHWLVMYDILLDTDYYNGDLIDSNNTIIAFDVESEEFRVVPHPEGCPDLRSFDSSVHQLVELRGLLCLSCAIDSKMDIWMLKDYCYESGNDHIVGTWMKEYSIDLNVLHRSYRLGDNPFRYYAPRDIEDTEVLIETHMKGLGYYHLQSKRFKGFIHSSRQMPRLRFSFYVESLRSLKQTISTGIAVVSNFSILNYSVTSSGKHEAQAEAKAKAESYSLTIINP
ncbi:F-box protein At3g07870-like [Telopea speciosissima]|uniref:F-box protein At3g07870-like n=1 Tax=Telopea speciosissima TaxID=54955 RepID=UPI001CC600DC|nr:F-box protein At3g07870-like [Telopea speciosissima]